MKPKTRLSLLALACSLFSSSAFAEPTPFAPQKDDVWVMAGDSITAQRQHSNFIEAFYRTRYPDLGMRFRNSGIGGNTTGSVMGRFDYDVAAWKPTVVSIELGMNDVGAGDDPARYVKGMRDLLAKIRAAKARPVFISSSPVNDGSLPGKWTSDRCRRIDPYTNALKALAAEEKVPFVDQYHPLLEMWGKNMQPPDGATPPADPKAWRGKVNLEGDAVHPGATGQYTMAATILGQLGVDREVSSATLKGDGTVVEAKRCKITDASAKDGVITFTRLDERGPWPIDPKVAKKALELMPEIADLSRYTLTVQGLPPGNYDVAIDGKPAATLTDKQLADGWNMSTVSTGALAERASTIVNLTKELQAKPNTEWRTASREQSTGFLTPGKDKSAPPVPVTKEQAAQKLAAAQAAIDAAEKALQAACQPAPLKFEIKPAK